MGVTIFFMILSVVLLIGTAIYLKKISRFYNFKTEDKDSRKKQKKNIKNIWGIRDINKESISVKGQHSIIIELGSIEYKLLNEKEQEHIDNILTKICKTMTYNMQFFSTIVKVDTSEKIEQIRRNMRKQTNSNMVEYGEAIIQYLEDIMQEDDLYVRKNYLIVSTFAPLRKAERDLKEYYLNLKYALSSIRVSCNMLNRNGIVNLIHKELNKNSNEEIEKIMKEGGFDIYVTNKEEQGKKVIIKEQKSTNTQKE